TAAAHAAWEGRDHVTREDIRAAALLSLPHRRRRAPFDAPGLDEDLLDALLDDEPEDDPPGDEGDDGPPEGSGPQGETTSDAPDGSTADSGDSPGESPERPTGPDPHDARDQAESSDRA